MKRCNYRNVECTEGAISEGPYYTNPKTLELLDELNNLSNGAINGTITKWYTYDPYFSDPMKTEMMNNTPSDKTKVFIKSISSTQNTPNMKDLYTNKNFSENVKFTLKLFVDDYRHPSWGSRQITMVSTLVRAKSAYM